MLPNCTKYFGGHCGLIIQSSLIFLYGLLKVSKLRSPQASIKTVCLAPSTNNTCRARGMACLETKLIYYLHRIYVNYTKNSFGGLLGELNYVSGGFIIKSVK